VSSGEKDVLYRTYNFCFSRARRKTERFLTKAIRRCGVPEKSTIDGSAAKAEDG